MSFWRMFRRKLFMNILKAVLFVVNKLGLVQPTAKVKKTNKPGTTDLSETLPQNVGITFQSMASGKLSALRALGVG